MARITKKLRDALGGISGILVTPFDKGQAKVIEKAIRDSDLGLEPAHQGGGIEAE